MVLLQVHSALDIYSFFVGLGHLFTLNENKVTSFHDVFMGPRLGWCQEREKIDWQEPGKFDCWLVWMIFIFCCPSSIFTSPGEWPENQILIPDWTYFHCLGATLFIQLPPRFIFGGRKGELQTSGRIFGIWVVSLLVGKNTPNTRIKGGGQGARRTALMSQNTFSNDGSFMAQFMKLQSDSGDASAQTDGAGGGAEVWLKKGAIFL